ncbi:hypothetical protein [Candidatus Poriferisodalis sp.]|uniref:hypothetical protein n=1 Tax=Candidatus Poriferisodalis sp. TaxID=3101277 RepID=UPI003B51EFA7
MILPDVNVLVYAYRADLDQNEVFRPWLEAALDRTEPIGLADVVLTGFLRVVTNRKAFANAATIQAAMSFVEEVRSAPQLMPASLASRGCHGSTLNWRTRNDDVNELAGTDA